MERVGHTVRAKSCWYRHDGVKIFFSEVVPLVRMRARTGERREAKTRRQRRRRLGSRGWTEECPGRGTGLAPAAGTCRAGDNWLKLGGGFQAPEVLTVATFVATPAEPWQDRGPLCPAV